MTELNMSKQDSDHWLYGVVNDNSTLKAFSSFSVKYMQVSVA